MPPMKIQLEISLDGSKMAGSFQPVKNPAANPPNSVTGIIDTMEGFDDDTINALKRMELHTIEKIPRRVQELWDNSTTTAPRLLPAERCWTSPPPTTSSVVLATLDLLRDPSLKQPTAYHRGERAAANFDRKTAVAQLIEPDGASPCVLIGFKLDLIPDEMLKCPLDLSTSVEPYLESGHQLLLTPKLSQSDLHIDAADAADGLSLPLGTCTKIWLLFPPTAKNLALLAKEEGRRSKLQRIGHLLEGGLILSTTSATAIYLPVGCIHGVFTTSGGFLNALDFITPDSMRTYSALFQSKIDRKNNSFGEECLNWFMESVELGLDGQHEGEALRAWVEAGERVREFGKGNARWRKKAMAVWDDFLHRGEARGMVCPCGQPHDGGIVEHFRVEHLWKKGPREKKEKESEPEPEPVVEAEPEAEPEPAPRPNERGGRKRGREEVEEQEAVEEEELGPRRSKRAKRPNLSRSA